MDQISEYWKIFINHLIQQIEKKLSQPQLNYNATSTSTAVGFDMKMTLHTTTNPPIQTQHEQYLTCYSTDQTLRVVFQGHLK